MKDIIITMIGYLPLQITENEEYLAGHFIMPSPNMYSSREKCVKLKDYSSSLLRCVMYYDNTFEYNGMLLDVQHDGSITIMPETLYPYLEEVHNKLENKYGPIRYSKIKLLEDEDYDVPTIYIEYIQI